MVNIKDKMKGKTAKSRVYSVLKERIIRGIYLGGRQLRQEELGSEFGVSRIPVREALIQLSGEGLVEFYPYKGAVVSPLSAEEAVELFEIRYILESAALEYATKNMTEADYDALELIIEEETPETHDNSILNSKFHITFYGHCNRPRLLEMISSLHQSVDRYIRVYLRLMDYHRISIGAHEDMLKACREGRIEDAKKLLRTHLQDASDRIASFLSFN